MDVFVGVFGWMFFLDGCFFVVFLLGLGGNLFITRLIWERTAARIPTPIFWGENFFKSGRWRLCSPVEYQSGTGVYPAEG